MAVLEPMSLFTFTHERFLEELRKKTRSKATEISEAVADAESLLDAERSAAVDARIRSRKSGWAIGESPGIPTETLDALAAMKPKRRKLVLAILDVMRRDGGSSLRGR